LTFDKAVNRRTFLAVGVSLVVLIAALVLVTWLPGSDHRVPARIPDAAFWGMVSDFSEEGGTFVFENIVSNEITFQRVIPALTHAAAPGGAYLGVGPEQNFTYIAALRPSVAFIIDIRRQNMMELLIYKAIFEMSIDRAGFISRLFSRRQPLGLSEASTADALFRAFGQVSPDTQLFEQNLKGIKERLIHGHRFPLSIEDQHSIDHVYQALFVGGPQITYAFRSPDTGAVGARAPRMSSGHTYASLMTASDGRGKNWSYLASESNFRLVREMQRRNLIVPLVGDFAGPKVIAEVGKYLRGHAATVSAFYTSNVEEYIRSPLGNYVQFCAGVATLPIDASSMFIRWTSGTAARTFLSSMREFVEAFEEGRRLPYEIRDAKGQLLADVSCH
jgi:hypothetical protein